MVDLSSINRNIGAENIAAALAGSQKANETKKKEVRRAAGRGLGLEDIPDTKNYVNVEETSSAEETQGAGDVSNVLDQIDADLQQVQDLLKNFIARKLQLADKHEDKRHELLISAFDDCKNAYTKIKEVRDNIS